jgi:hypothetical protein
VGGCFVFCGFVICRQAGGGGAVIRLVRDGLVVVMGSLFVGVGGGRINVDDVFCFFSYWAVSGV